MRVRIALIATIAGATLFAVSTGIASAKSDKLTCKGNQTKSNIDGHLVRQQHLRHREQGQGHRFQDGKCDGHGRYRRQRHG